MFHQQDSSGLNEGSGSVGFGAVLHRGSWNSAFKPVDSHPHTGASPSPSRGPSETPASCERHLYPNLATPPLGLRASWLLPDLLIISLVFNPSPSHGDLIETHPKLEFYSLMKSCLLYVSAQIRPERGHTKTTRRRKRRKTAE